MTLESGTRLGPYEIVELRGKGGMGEVYLAKDSRLDRDVAIKVLPERLSKDRVYQRRLEREAKTISQLQHTHICMLHDVGVSENAEALSYLVMEFLEGETLEERLLRGPLDFEEALRIGREVAEAIEAAHRQGIVHRDLKPSNVMLTDQGTKVLDFGLAKAIEGDLLAADPDAPTKTQPITQVGTLAGTVPYMAPEQLEGLPADARTDLWSLGCVVYEMVTGQRPFTGSTQASLIGAIMRGRPKPLLERLPLAPAQLDRVVSRCLVKDPERRWQSARDVAIELEALVGTPRSNSQRKGLRRSGLVAVTLLLAGAAVWWLAERSKRPDQNQAADHLVVRSVLSAPPSAPPSLQGRNGALAIAPDGTKVVYVHSDDGGYVNLYLRPVDRLEGVPLTDGFGFMDPFFSPDGAWVGVRQLGSLKKVSILGGPAITLCEPGAFRGASWGPDDSIIFAQAGSDPGLYRVAGTGGEPEILLELDTGAGERQYSAPEILPDGGAVLFAIKREQGSEIAVYDLDVRVKKTLLADGSSARYASTGHLVFQRGETLVAVAFDIKNLEVTGSPTQVLEGVVTELEDEAANFAISRTGRLVYISGERPNATLRRLVWVDRLGREEPLPVPLKGYLRPRMSPDGQKVALAVANDGTNSLWIWDLERETLTPLTSGGQSESMALWTPDSRRIVFSRSLDPGTLRLFERSADGSGVAEQVSTEKIWTPYSISPDEQWLIGRGMLNSDDLQVLSLESLQMRPLLQSKSHERNGELSPKGRWLAYESNKSGTYEIYVHPFPDVERGQWTISNGGGTQPQWSRDGRELFYYSNGEFMVVAVETAGEAFRAGIPEVLFKRRLPGNDGCLCRQYDASPDGERFLMIDEVEPGSSSQQLDVVLVDNWFEELKRLVPSAQ